jgi:hypothetical protein
MDWGPDAMLDTKALLEKMGILTIGVGENLREARKPAFIERKGIKVAFLDYCSVLHEGYEAGPDKAGVAPLRIHTYYEAFDYQAGIPPKVVTIPYEELCWKTSRLLNSSPIFWYCLFTGDYILYRV